MKRFWTLIVGWLAAGFAALCCFGIPLALSGLALLGLPFLTSDLFLIPLMAAALGLFLWGMYRSRINGNLWPMILSISGALFAFAGIWLSAIISTIGFLLMAAGFVYRIILRNKKLTTSV